MKKTKVLNIILILIILLFSMCSVVNADSILPSAGSGSYGGGQGSQISTTSSHGIKTDNFDPAKNPLTDNDTASAFKLAGTIVEVIRIVGLIIAFVGIIAIGIKFMAGSVEERAEYKKSLLPYLIGCIMIFTITTILSIIYSLVTQVKA